MTAGRRLALAVLALELGLALALVAKDVGLFALMAMPFVGVAWLPASAMMLGDLRRDADARPRDWLVAVLCLAAGAFCLAVSARWVSTAMFVR